MNETLATIKNRRSVRFFDNKILTKEEIETIIEAGNHAPTGANIQPWRFVVVTSEEIKKKLVINAKPVYKKWLETSPEIIKNMRKSIDEMIEDSIYYSAPAIIFVIGNGFSAAKDCPMVCQNMMLAARAIGIGSCWVEFGQMGINGDIKEILEIKDGDAIYGPIIFGYPRGEFPESPSKKEAVIKWF